MTLSSAIRDREFQKFCEVSGQTAVRTCTTIEGGSIDATPSGLQNDFRTTTMMIGDTAIPIPAVALTDRNSLSIVNLDPVETLYIWVFIAHQLFGYEVPKVNTTENKNKAFCNEILSIIINENTSHIDPNSMMLALESDERFTKVGNEKNKVVL